MFAIRSGREAAPPSSSILTGAFTVSRCRFFGDFFMPAEQTDRFCVGAR
jgi:hypothetical protein